MRICFRAPSKLAAVLRSGETKMIIMHHGLNFNELTSRGTDTDTAGDCQNKIVFWEQRWEWLTFLEVMLFFSDRSFE